MGTKQANAVAESRTSDRRFRRSRKALQSAVVKLLQDNQLSDIKIAELTEEADVNRRTFYLHFKSIEELLENYIDEELAAIEQELTEDMLRLPFNYEAFITVLIKHVEAQGDNLELLVQSGAVQIMNAALEKMIRNIYGKALSVNGLQDTSNVMMDYIAGFAIGACIGLLNKWISRGRVEPVSEVVAISISLFKPLLEHGAQLAATHPTGKKRN